MLKFSNFFKHLLSYILGATLVIGGVVFAGTLTPSVSTDTANFVTLSDIYNKIILNTYSTSTHSISTTSAPTASMHTLYEIYNIIPTLLPATILTNTTIMGVAGTYNTSNLIPGNVATGTAYGTSSVGTLVEAQATEWDATDNPAGNVNWFAGGTYCASLSSVGGTKDGMPWRLPSQTELIAKYNGDHSGFEEYGTYWSGTTDTDPEHSDSAYGVHMTFGPACCASKLYLTALIRCVR